MSESHRQQEAGFREKGRKSSVEYGVRLSRVRMGDLRAGDLAECFMLNGQTVLLKVAETHDGEKRFFLGSYDGKTYDWQ